MIHYVYYSARNFQRRVDAGQSAWEAVEYMPRGGRADPRIPAVDAVAHLNQYGLPQSVPELELLKNGNAALLECITAVRPENYFHSGNDATAMQLEDGTYSKYRRARYGFYSDVTISTWKRIRRYPARNAAGY